MEKDNTCENIKYAKIIVKTNSGFKVSYRKFIEPLIFGKYLLKYYGSKEYEWYEINDIKMLKIILGKNNFENIKLVN